RSPDGQQPLGCVGPPVAVDAGLADGLPGEHDELLNALHRLALVALLESDHVCSRFCSRAAAGAVGGSAVAVDPRRRTGHDLAVGAVAVVIGAAEAAAGVAADGGDRGGGDPHDELHVRAATGAVVDEVADLRRAVVAAAGAEPRDPDRAASGARPGAGVAGLLQAPGQEAVAPRVAEAAVGVARDLAEPPVVLRVVVAGLAVADLGGGHLDHALHAHGASSSSASGSKPPSGCTSSSTNSAPASCRIAASRCACRSVAVRSSVASHSAVGSGSGVGSVIGCSNAKAPRSAGLVLFDGGGLSRRPWWARGSGRPGRTR